MGGKRKKHGRTGPLPNQPDVRLHAVQIGSITEHGVVIPQENAWATLSGIVRQDDGTSVLFPHPFIPGFYLTEAMRIRKRGGNLLRQSLSQTRTDPNTGAQHVTMTKHLLDAISDLSIAVLLAVAGLEAIANECINRLDDQATVSIKKQGEVVEIAKVAMERGLSLKAKFDRVIPTVSGRPSIKGTAAWETLNRLTEMRNELVHVKNRGYSMDPDEPSIFGRIILGRTLTCVDDALFVVDAAFPDILFPQTRKDLGLAPVDNS